MPRQWAAAALGGGRPAARCTCVAIVTVARHCCQSLLSSMLPAALWQAMQPALHPGHFRRQSCCLGVRKSSHCSTGPQLASQLVLPGFQRLDGADGGLRCLQCVCVKGRA
jgi:hypothetical protein